MFEESLALLEAPTPSDRKRQLGTAIDTDVEVVRSVSVSRSGGMGSEEGAEPGFEGSGGASSSGPSIPLSLLGEWDMDERVRALDHAARDADDLEFEVASVAHSEQSLRSRASTVVAYPSMFVGSRKEVMQKRSVESFEQLPDVLPPPTPHVVVRASSAFIDSAALGAVPCIRDESGRVIQWPWQLPDSAYGGAGCALPKQTRQPHRTDSLRLRGMDASMASGDMGRGSTGVRAWRAFCAEEHTPADRPIDPSSPLWVKLEEELLAMQFVCALVEDRGVAVGTAASYFGQVQGWHAKEHGVKLAAGMKLARLPAMLKGLRRLMGEAPRAVRRGIAPQALRRAMDLLLVPSVPAHANVRAALSVALQGLLRSAEYACDGGVKFQSSKHLTRADISECSETRLVIMMLPCKNMRHLSGKTCPLVIGAGGQYVDAVAEVRNMLVVDPVAASAAEVTPMFRVPATNEPLRTAAVRDLVRSLMQAIGEADPSQFGTHSLRIGGATALFVAGADETVIRTMGRWSSDCYRLYVRACFESTLKWSRAAGSTTVSDVAGEFDEVDFY